MRRVLPPLFLLIFSLPAFGQQIQYEIRGKINRINNNKKQIFLIFHTTVISTGKTDTAIIDEDGLFTFNGNLFEAQEALLQIDSSDYAFFWIDSGLINMQITEWRYENIMVNLLRITELNGPTDSYLYQYSNEIGRRAYNFFVVPDGVDAKKFKESNPPVAMMTPVHSNEEWTQKRDSVIYRCIDSIMMERPACKILPHYINFYSSLLGPVKTGKLYSRLSPELRNSVKGKEIKEYLDQQSVLRTGSVIKNFTMKDTSGKSFNLNDVKNDYILLDFWASWCGPCRANNPFLRRANELYGSRGLTIIGISLDDDKESWLEGIRTDNLNWINVSELKEFDGAFVKRCKLRAIPYSILLDKNKRIVKQDLVGAELLAELEAIFK